MAEPTTLMTLPPELRERIYEYVAQSYTTRRVRTVDSKSDNVPEFKTTTSAISATCRLVNKEYEAVARKSTTTLKFAATNMDFSPIMAYFDRKVDPQFLATLKQNKAIILVNIVIDNQNYQRNLADFTLGLCFSSAFNWKRHIRVTLKRGWRSTLRDRMLDSRSSASWTRIVPRIFATTLRRFAS